MMPALLITPFSDLVDESVHGSVNELLAGLDAVAGTTFGLAVCPRESMGDAAAGVLATGPRREPLPAGAFNSRRGQYDASGLLAVLAQKSDSRVVVLGVTGVDIFAPRLNFVFGMADRAAGAAVISLHRLTPEFYGEDPDESLFKERTAREAIHELGHVLGLSHCRNPGCTMRFSSTIKEADDKGPGFCGRCASILAERGYHFDETGNS